MWNKIYIFFFFLKKNFPLHLFVYLLIDLFSYIFFLLLLIYHNKNDKKSI